MQVFKAYFRTLYANKLQFVIYFAVFMLILGIMGNNGTTEANRTFEGRHMKAAVIDDDNTEMSMAVKEYLAATCKVVDPGTVDPETLKDDANFGMLDYVVIIPDGFGEKVKGGDCKGSLEYLSYPRSTGGYLMTERMNSFVKNISAYLKCGYSEKEAAGMALETAEKTADVTMLETQQGNTSDSILFYYFQYYAYAALMMMLVGIGEASSEFRKEELINRMRCTPLTPVGKSIQMIAGYVTTGVAVWAAFMICAALFCHSDPGFHKLGSYAVNALVITMVGLSLSFLVSTIVRDTNVINMVANMLVMGMCFLSGIYVPAEYMSASVLSFARFLPTYWFVKVNGLIAGNAVLTGSAAVTFRNCMLMQLLFAAVFLACGMAVTKLKKQ